MAIKIRLARGGAKKRPFYQIVVADARSPRDGRFVERVGTYNPMLPQDDQNRIRLKEDRIKYWLSVGAQPTDRVALFLGKANIIDMPTTSTTPKKSTPKAKAQERLKEAEEAKKALEEAAKAPKQESVTKEDAAIAAGISTGAMAAETAETAEETENANEHAIKQLMESGEEPRVEAADAVEATEVESHTEVTVDPASGTVTDATVETELSSDPVDQTDIS